MASTWAAPTSWRPTSRDLPSRSRANIATMSSSVPARADNAGASANRPGRLLVNAGAAVSREDTFGVVSLIVWALTLAVSIKYVTFVMRADNRGEGGILALLALLPRRVQRARISVIALLVIAGASLLFGDGMITPAISVLSALEGLRLAAPGFEPFIVPLTCAVLVGLFAIQSRGTGRVGMLFGPVMVVWFVTIGTLGLRELLQNPAILGALSPHWGARYFARHGPRGLGILGVVVLAITGDRKSVV